jgi:hypothetical protein
VYTVNDHQRRCWAQIKGVARKYLPRFLGIDPQSDEITDFAALVMRHFGVLEKKHGVLMAEAAVEACREVLAEEQGS